MTSSTRVTKTREPQQDRSRATQQRLLETAVECLAELGWAATSVGLVAERAGVSRGAAQHHFPTREALFMAAVDHMGEQRGQELRGQAAELPDGPDRTLAVLELISGFYIGPLFRAALQVWVTASSDEALRAKVIPLEARFGREVHAATVELLGLDESVEGVRETVMATLDLVRGLALADILTDDSRRRTQVLRQWASVLDQTLEMGV
ncbi:TetR/AcrR family transcriptional regulator [Luteipulveratus mongoliensis]|uniref:TetR family transcriptional regulator n=1 Tax=Luteipulveratus mongoliensis TaxID=571913 RepID=A0A0K1JF95_9MICO|nr:TetR/AcrR family transcriptional regulator [Luteipulveratus mongoliensis]AKU15397.1 TetR family transcriptional regulator [Luteipulveratus mongoliensis]